MSAGFTGTAPVIFRSYFYFLLSVYRFGSVYSALRIYFKSYSAFTIVAACNGFEPLSLLFQPLP